MDLTLERAAELYHIIGVLNQRIKDHWNDGEAYNKRGACYEQLGNTQYAIEDYTDAIRYNPYPHHYTDRARLYLSRGNYIECIADCNMAEFIARRQCELHHVPYIPFTLSSILREEAYKNSEERTS